MKMWFRKRTPITLYKIYYKYDDGTEETIVMDAHGVNNAVVHDYCNYIFKVEKVESGTN